MMYKVGQVAQQTGLSIRTLRHYDDLGLLIPSGRTDAAYRLYSADDLTRLLHIQSLKSLGLSLPEIKRALDDPTYDAHVVLQQHITLLQERIAQETALLERLKHLQQAGEVGWAELAATIALTSRVQRRVQQFVAAAQEMPGKMQLTPEQLKHLHQQPLERQVEEDWGALISDIFTALEQGLSPETEEAQALARRWQNAVTQATGQRQDIAQAIGQTYQQHLPPEFQAMWRLISEALRQANNGVSMNSQFSEHYSDLFHLDKNIRIRAALDLGAMKDEAALPTLLQRLGQEPDFYVRENLTWAVTRMAKAALPLLEAQLNCPDAATRLQATHTLSKIADPASTAVLLELLKDEDAEVARKAIFALGQIQNTDALKALIAALGHPNAERRNTLSNAVVVFGQAAVPLLLDVLKASDGAGRTHAAEILGLIGDPVAAGALTEALHDEVWDVQFAALSALGHLPGEDARQAVKAATAFNDVRLRAVAQRLAGFLSS